MRKTKVPLTSTITRHQKKSTNEETLKLPKLFNLKNQHGGKAEIINSPLIKKCDRTKKRKPKLTKIKSNLNS